MISIKIIRRIFSKTLAIAEKNVRTQFRFKAGVIFWWIVPFISFLMPIIILNKFFEYNITVDPWTPQNFMIFIFIGYIIMLMRKMIDYIPRYLLQEKYWKTLPALIIAPFNRFYLLFGYILSEFLELSIPFVLYFIIMLIIMPIAPATILIVLLMFISIGIVFSGVGLFLGVFAISNENYLYVFGLGIRIIFWFSCVSYPFQFFPQPIQNIIALNPLYYLIDTIRLTWIENNIILTALSHHLHVFLFLVSLIIFPIICVYLFNYIYRKLGISGY